MMRRARGYCTNVGGPFVFLVLATLSRPEWEARHLDCCLCGRFLRRPLRESLEYFGVVIDLFKEVVLGEDFCWKG